LDFKDLVGIFWLVPAARASESKVASEVLGIPEPARFLTVAMASTGSAPV